MILCYSGGLDSLVAWHYLCKPKSIYFDCSSVSSNEKRSISETNPKCIIDHSLDLIGFEEGINSYVLNRNLLFASIASNYASVVVIAGVKDDNVEDKNPDAFRMMSDVLSNTSKKEIQVISPFWNMTKSEVIKWFLENVPDAKALIGKSTSCYSGTEGGYCGRCPSCFRKACALFSNGIKLPFNDVNLAQKYTQKAYNGEYDPERCMSILNYVGELKLWQRCM